MNITLAIKMGSTSTIIYRENEGMVLREPSLVAVSGSLHTKEIKAVGAEAERMLGRTSEGTSVVAPITAGVITDDDLAVTMLKYFLHKVCPRKLIKPNIKAVICVPLGLSLQEKKTYERVCFRAGINDCILFPAILCDAIGDNVKIDTAVGKLCLAIGGGCTNVAAISMNNIISGVSVDMGGININTAIEKQLFNDYNIILGEGISERIKHDIGSLHENYLASTEVFGIDATTKQSKSITLSSKELYPIMTHYFDRIIEIVQSVIAVCPPDIISDITNDGIYVFGGLTSIPGVEKYLQKKLGLPVHITEHIKTDIAGAAKLLENPRLLKQLLSNIS